MMEFGYIGINYKNADQDIRDGVSFTDNGKIDFMEKAADAGINQCMVLSTCNRSEVYYLVQDTEEHETMERLYRDNFRRSVWMSIWIFAEENRRLPICFV